MGNAISHLPRANDANLVNHRNFLSSESDGGRMRDASGHRVWILFRQGAGQFRHGLEQVSDKPEIGYLEDRRVFILVDGDDHLAVLHAGEMLDGTRDADGDVELR